MWKLNKTFVAVVEHFSGAEIEIYPKPPGENPALIQLIDEIEQVI